MGTRGKTREFARRLWSRAVKYCEAKDKIAEMLQRVNSATGAVEDARNESEKKISGAKAQAQHDIECAKRDKDEAERAIADKQHDLELLKSRIDEESIPIAKDLVEKAKKESEKALRQFEKDKRIADSLIEKIRERIDFYEKKDFDLTFEGVQDLREKLEYEYYNTERKLDAIHKVIGNWVLPKTLRNHVDDDRQFMNSLKRDEPWID